MKYLAIKLGLRIRKSRRSLDITQKDLGKKVGCVTSHICDMEKGNKNPNLEMLFKLEKELGPLWGNWK